MKSFLTEIRIAIVATILFAVVCSGIYPVVIWGASQLLFPHQANGSIIKSSDNKTRIGSSLLAQGFSGAKYFHPRPSNAGTGYDGSSSGGSNLGPTSQKLIDQIKGNVETYRKENDLAADAVVPADAVTASFSGLDPHISLRNAELQAPRVAKERGLSPDAVKAEIAKATESPFLGIGGESGVNVLLLNLALDAQQKTVSSSGTPTSK
jgi:potassium-transporting ATPase KdpC subunit